MGEFYGTWKFVRFLQKFGFVSVRSWQVLLKYFIYKNLALVEQELFTRPEHLNSSPVFSGICATRSLVLCVCFVDRCLSFCPFLFAIVLSVLLFTDDSSYDNDNPASDTVMILSYSSANRVILWWSSRIQVPILCQTILSMLFKCITKGDCK